MDKDNFEKSLDISSAGMRLTCSMDEIKNITTNNLKSCKTGKQFLESFVDEEGDNEDGDRTGRKAVIYNTSNGGKSFNTEMTRFGFNKVLQYPGNSNKTIYTWVAKTSDIRKVK